MQRLELTLPDPAANLALDEALLERAEQLDGPEDGGEVLRLWEPAGPLVVVGRASPVEVEVRIDACRDLGIPIFRRASGGAAIVAAPGCLMYAFVLSYQRRPALRAIDRAHALVLETIAEALRRRLPSVARAGISDLVVDVRGRRKFSGNSLRSKRNWFLYHGTVLYDLPLNLLDTCLKLPPRQPAYREGRGHVDFVANLPLARNAIREALIEAWQADQAMTDWPQARVATLVAEKYSRRDWNFQL